MRALFCASLLFLFAPIAESQTAIVDFDNPRPPGNPGAYLRNDFGGINWGTNQWRWSGPFGADPTNNAYFGSSSGNSRTFTFTDGPRIFYSIDVYTLRNGTLTLSDDSGQTIQQSITRNSMQSVVTDWTEPSNTVTVTFTAGWDLGIDNVVHGPAVTGPPPQFDLMISIDGAGAGTVTSQPAGIDCQPNCVSSFDENTVVDLAAIPVQGSGFSGWSGDPDCTDSSVTMTGDISCTATFVSLPPPTFDLQVTRSGVGSGTVTSAPAGIDCGTDCQESYLENTVVTLSAVPDVDSIFDGWSGDPDCSDGVVTVSSNLSCDAIFNTTTPPQQFSLSVSTTGSGTGTIESSPDGIDCGVNCQAAFDENAQVTLTATPGPISAFVGWSGDADCADGVLTMSEDQNCVADFQNIGGGGGTALRFFGSGVSAPDRDRLKFRIDDPTTSDDQGFFLDVGATDFTIEFWMSGLLADNGSSSVNCGSNDNWIRGNIIIDRDRFNQSRKFGLSVGGGTIAFGVTGGTNNSTTICGTAPVLDGNWHHIAIQREVGTGAMSVYVDGVLDVAGQGAIGDISYPDTGVPGNYCGSSGNQACTESDPFLVIGAEKHDVSNSFPSFSGTIDELRISDTIRYVNDFQRPTTTFTRDANTLGLFHFDEGAGDVTRDDIHPSDGSRDGVLRIGGAGTAIGPQWVDSTAPLTP